MQQHLKQLAQRRHEKRTDVKLMLKADGTADAGGSPLICHNERLADPLDPFTRAISAISKKRSKQEADHLEIGHLECLGGLWLPRQWRNEAGQLRMDAPYSHRDFRRPEFGGPRDEGLRDLVIKRAGAFHGFHYPHAPLDVVGWDGTVYPWAFPILSFQPRVGMVHLPPTVHGTFGARGALICSFVPRPLDFHPHLPKSSPHRGESNWVLPLIRFGSSIAPKPLHTLRRFRFRG